MSHLAPKERIYASTGYLMIRSLEVHNFRCFKHAKLDECKRINILVGRNASGKTSLLEALFLVLGNNVANVTTLRQWRGVEGNMMQGSISAIHEIMWRDLFNEYNGSKPIKIVCKGDPAQERELTISPVSPTVSLSPNDKTYIVNSKSEGVKFKWRAKGLPDFETTPMIAPTGMQLAMGPETVAEVFLFAANQTYSAIELSSRFSALSRRMEIKPFIDVFRGRYPQIEDMSIEMYANSPLIYVKVRNVNDKIPISLLSGGINKFAAILLSFVSSPKSVVLIDEVENGLYYKDLPKIWELLRDFAEQFDCQIFASTHSEECINAASSVARDHQTSFSVIQAVDGKLNQFQGDKFVWAADEQIEIR